MATFIDEVKELGLKQASVAKVDEVVERFTAGLNLTDVRSALRGDEPRRPNPRLRPHADGFWFHIRPSFYHAEVTHIYPTFRLGWLSTFMLVWETLTGIFLMVFYTPDVDAAYNDMWTIMSNVPLGQLMRNLHRFGAEMMVLVVALHMLRTFLTGSYKKPRQFTWLTGMILLCLTLILSFSGYLLPWDQLAYWAVTVAVSAAEASPGPPVVGQTINNIVRGAPTIGQNGLLRFYLLHVLALPLITAIFTFVHYYKVVLHGHSLPPGREAIGEDTAKRVPKNERVYFIPDILTSEIMWIAMATLFLVGGSMFNAIGLGTAVIETHANPIVTPLHVVAPWYLSWSQGWLKLASKEFIAFVFIPGLATLFFIWPYLEEFRPAVFEKFGFLTVSRRYADRRGELSLCFLFIAFMLVSNWQGSPKFLVRGSSDQEVAQELMPQEGHSPLLEVPYEDLREGRFYPTDEDIELVDTWSHDFAHALEEFQHGMFNFSCYYDDGSGYENVNDYGDCKVVNSIDEESGAEITRFGNHFTKDAMVNPDAWLDISKQQHNMYKLELSFFAKDPLTGVIAYDNTGHPWTKYRHETSFYEEY